MLRDQLRELLAPVVAGLGYQLWELEFLPRSGGGLLRIYIDAAICSRGLESRDGKPYRPAPRTTPVRKLPDGAGENESRLARGDTDPYNSKALMRGGAVWQLVGLITRRS